MDIDFPLILMVLTALTGLVAVADRLFFLPRRLAKLESLDAQGAAKEDLDSAAKESFFIAQSKSFFPVLLIVFVLRSFIAEPFQIPSASMESTLVEGDFILVNKFHYGLRMPVFRNLLVGINEPKRGDVMVFFPPHDKRYFIKRVIGLPGDHVVYSDGQLIINGEPKDIEIISAEPAYRPTKYLLEETLSTGPHQVQWTPGTNVGPSGEWTVPEGHYFMMGDNRGRSSDSRLWRNPVTNEPMPFVPAENIVGKAVAIWMHWDKESNFPTFSSNEWIK